MRKHPILLLLLLLIFGSAFQVTAQEINALLWKISGSNEQIAGKRIKDVADKMDPVIKDGGALITLDLANIMDNKNNILSELKNRGYVLTTVAQ